MRWRYRRGREREEEEEEKEEREEEGEIKRGARGRRIEGKRRERIESFYGSWELMQDLENKAEKNWVHPFVLSPWQQQKFKPI